MAAFTGNVYVETSAAHKHEDGTLHPMKRVGGEVDDFAPAVSTQHVCSACQTAVIVEVELVAGRLKLQDGEATWTVRVPFEPGE
jgi:hypothetical protein